MTPLSYHSSNLSLIAVETIRLLVPTQREFKPGIFILHVATNDLPLNKSTMKISENIVTLSESMKTKNKIIICSTVCRAGSSREKVDEVNAHLEEICAENNIAIITQSNII